MCQPLVFLLGSALADCPTWFYYDNTTQQSHCGHEFSCSSNNKVEIENGMCATSAGEGDSSFSDSGGVSGPSDSGSRSTSGDTGEGELRTGSTVIRVYSECHTIRY